MQGITLAGLTPKLRQIASIRKKQSKYYEMGYLRYGFVFDFRLTVLALAVKVYWGQGTISQILGKYVFSTTASKLTLLVLEQRILHHLVSLVKTNRLIPQLCPKSQIKNLTSRPIWGHRSGQVEISHIGYHLIWGNKTNTLVPFAFIYRPWLKRYGQMSNFPIKLYSFGSKINLD